LDAIGGGLTNVFGDLLAVLAFDGADEGTEIVVGLLARFSADKVLGDALMQGGKADGPSPYFSRIEVSLNHAWAPPVLTAWPVFYQVRL
jgi:hypothetical protein